MFSQKGSKRGDGEQSLSKFFGNLFLKILTEGVLRVDFDGWDFI